MRRKRLPTLKAYEAPKIGKLFGRHGNGKGKYQPIKRQSLASRNIEADAVVNAADHRVKTSASSDS